MADARGWSPLHAFSKNQNPAIRALSSSTPPKNSSFYPSTVELGLSKLCGRPDRTACALHAGRSGPRDRLRRPSPRRKLSERPASEAQPARPSAVLAPSRVQRRGVEARRVSRRAWGGEARERRAGGMVRAARQRREVGTLILWPRSALLVTEYGGFNEVQETPPGFARSAATSEACHGGLSTKRRGRCCSTQAHNALTRRLFD